MKRVLLVVVIALSLAGCGKSAEQVYFERMSEAAKRLTPAVSVLEQAVASPRTVVMDDDAQAQIEASATTVHDINTLVNSLEAPEKFAASHAAYIRALGEMNAAATDLETAMGYVGDGEDVASARAHMEKATIGLESAAQLLDIETSD